MIINTLLSNGAGGSINYETPTSASASSTTSDTKVVLNGIQHEPFCITHVGSRSTYSSGVSYEYADTFGYIKEEGETATKLVYYTAKSGTSGYQYIYGTSAITVQYDATAHTVTIETAEYGFQSPTNTSYWKCFYI